MISQQAQWWVTIVLSLFGALGVPGLAIYYVRDKRQSRAAAEVAERTTNAKVDLENTTALDARMVSMARTYLDEQETLRRHMSDLRAELAEARAEITHLERESAAQKEQIVALRAEVSKLRGEVHP